MTNKPMLSVERELLSNLSYAIAANDMHACVSIGKELRALLDKEVDGNSHAPKHQGEPVVVVMPEHTMRSVMDATQQARGFPVLTSNQCHALAVSLNYVASLGEMKP